jgi:hypothetical protein
MITHDNIFEDLAVAPVKQLDVVIARQVIDPYGYYDDTLVWSSSDMLMSVKIDSVGGFLGAATKKATVKLIGLMEDPVVGDTFHIRTGLFDTALDSFNYISQGFYIAESVTFDYEAGSTTVVLYDHMWRAQETQYNDTIFSTGFTFPATVEALANHIASTIGVELMPGFASLPNASYVIEVDPFATISNVTAYTVIQELAATTGTTARISDTSLMFTSFVTNWRSL